MSELDELCVNTIRFLSVDAVEKAKSGHPGLPLGAAPMAYVLWDRHLRHNPANPRWWNRDRFVLSAGHGSALLYSLLHLTGYDLPVSELQRFRQWESRTPGHPEHGLTAGVEATTGPLGQGFAMGVGMAVAERSLASAFNRTDLPVIDHRTFAIVSDGDLMEGVASEAASVAGHLGLGKLLYLYDNNHVTLEGPASAAFTEDVLERFRAYRWNVDEVEDGNDLEAIDQAIQRAKRVADRPSLISVRTHIGYGSPKQDTHQAHGEPLGPEATRATKEKLGFPLEPPFLVPETVRSHMLEARARGASQESAWEELHRRFQQQAADSARELRRRMLGELPAGWAEGWPSFGAADGQLATREASGKVLNAVAAKLPELVGGSADLNPSTKTYLDGLGDFAAGSGAGRNLHFGVREHAMVGILNGMALHDGVLPYGATFLVFSDYARGSIRLASLMRTHLVLVFTHDSVAVGEDGPTHQPVEHVLSLRAIPDLTVLRPADAKETRAAWKVALTHKGPVALILTRQKLPVLGAPQDVIDAGVARGAYVLSSAHGGPPRAVILATGSEVHLALAAQSQLRTQWVETSVVSMPSWELFDQLSPAERTTVLPPNVPRVSVEAGRTLGWERYVGPGGIMVGIDHFGASAPGPTVQEKLGLTVEHVVAAVRGALENPP